MGYQSTTAQDLITDALRDIGVLSDGEVPSANEATDSLRRLNDLLDSWSTDHITVFSQTENILTFTAGQYQYSIGNYTAGTFTGNLTASSNVISSVTVPAGLTVGGTVTDTQSFLPAGTTITAIGTNTVTLSNNALSTISGNADIFTYTIPGNFAIPRPLRITNAFTRITTGAAGLDYPIDMEFTREKYNDIGLKSVQGPWPVLGWYNPTFPLGTLYFYPNPSGAGQLHLFTDNQFTNFTSVTQSINLPPGYARAIKKNLSLELSPEYGKTPNPELIRQAKEALSLIQDNNTTPAVQAQYDRDIVRSHRTDAGWILHGGFL